MGRRGLGLILIALGVACLGLDARWLEVDGELIFRWSFWGQELWSGGRALLHRAATNSARAQWASLILVASLCALGAGHALSRRLQSRGALAFALAGGLALTFSLNPGLVDFVAGRDGLSAPWYLDLGDSCRALGWGVILVGLWLVLDQPSNTNLARRDPALEWVQIAVAALVAISIPAWLCHGVLGGKPLTNDGAAYLFQSTLFARGNWMLPAGPLDEFYAARQVLMEPGWFSKYTPGHSALLAVGERLIGEPELLPRLGAGLSVVLTALIARLLGCERPHRAAWCFALSPALLGVEGLWLAHTSSLPVALIFGWTALHCLRALGRSDSEHAAGPSAWKWALGAGAAFALLLAIRPLTAVALTLPFLIALLRRGGKRTPAIVGATIIGALPLVSVLLWANSQYTGSLWKSAYQLYAERWSPNDQWGLVNQATAWTTTNFNTARLSTWMFGIAPGLWLPIAGWCFRRKGISSSLTWAPMISLVALYSLHRFHGIPWVGPLYWVEAMPFLAVLSAQGTIVLENVLGRRALVASFAVVCLASGQLLGQHFSLAREEVAARNEVLMLIPKERVEQAVIFIPRRSARAQKRFSLLPALNEPNFVLAVDRGARNQILLDALGNPPGFRFVAGDAGESGRLIRLEASGTAGE